MDLWNAIKSWWRLERLSASSSSSSASSSGSSSSSSSSALSQREIVGESPRTSPFHPQDREPRIDGGGNTGIVPPPGVGGGAAARERLAAGRGDDLLIESPFEYQGRYDGFHGFSDHGSGEIEAQRNATLVGGAATTAALTGIGLPAPLARAAGQAVGAIAGAVTDLLGLGHGLSPQEQAFLDAAPSVQDLNQRALALTGAQGTKVLGHDGLIDSSGNFNTEGSQTLGARARVPRLAEFNSGEEP